MKLLIKGGNLIGYDKPADILMDGGKVKTIAYDIVEQCDKVIDAKGKYVLPGLIDMHVHLREPGFEHKENIYTGAKAAAKGDLLRYAACQTRGLFAIMNRW